MNSCELHESRLNGQAFGDEDMDAELAKLPDMRRAIYVLERALERLVDDLGRPEFRNENGKKRFRYRVTSARHLQVLKCVRVISGLNSLMILLQAGFTQEMGVILRTVDDFIAEVDFVTEAIRSGTPTVDQKKFIELFFADDMRTTEELLQSERGPHRVVRSKIQASEGRRFGGDNPHELRTMVRAVDDLLSAYVHGAYPCIMELYEGGAWKFHIRGVLDTPLVGDFRKQVAIYIHRSLNIFAGLFLQVKQQEVADELIRERRLFEATPAYAD